MAVRIFQAFPGSFESGSKCIAIFSKLDTNTYWNPWALLTTLTDEEAESLWGTSKRAMHCEFYDAVWKDRDDGDYSADFSEEELLALGITNKFKGFFADTDEGLIDGAGDNIYVTPSEIVNGQRIVIYNNSTDEAIDYVNFTENSKSTFWTMNFNVLTLLILLIAVSFYVVKNRMSPR
jgi:hypothetical protein